MLLKFKSVFLKASLSLLLLSWAATVPAAEVPLRTLSEALSSFELNKFNLWVENGLVNFDHSDAEFHTAFAVNDRSNEHWLYCPLAFFIEGAGATIKQTPVADAEAAQVLKLILAAGHTPGHLPEESQVNYLNLLASAHGARYYKQVKALLAGAADMNSKDELGRTVFHYLAEKAGDEGSVSQRMHESMDIYLDAKGLDLNIRDDLGTTPLHLAVSRNNNKAIRKLLKHGADVNIRDRRGKTAIWYVANYGISRERKNSRQRDLWNMLVDSGLDINIPNSDGITITMDALLRGSVDEFNYLKGLGGSLDPSESFRDNANTAQQTVDPLEYIPTL